MQNEHNCLVVGHSLALPFFGTRMKTDIFQSCGHCGVFQICWHIEWAYRWETCLTGEKTESQRFLFWFLKYNWFTIFQAKWFFMHKNTHTHTHIYFSNSFPLWAIPRYSVQFPVLYSRFLLFICFMCNSVYLLILNLQFILPLPSLVTRHLFSVSVSLFLLYK